MRINFIILQISSLKGVIIIIIIIIIIIDYNRFIHQTLIIFFIAEALELFTKLV